MFRETGSPRALPGLPTSPPALGRADLVGGRGGGTKLSRTEKSQGRRQERERERERAGEATGRTARRKGSRAK